MKSLTKVFFAVNIGTTSCRFLLMSAMLGAFSLSPRQAVAEVSQIELQRGIQSFNSKHYSDAVGHLQQYVAAAPHESIGHYYLANCLFNLGYQKPSLVEYTLALKESTSQKMTDYCRDAIRSIQSSKQIANTTLQAPGHDGSTANQIQQYGSELEERVDYRRRGSQLVSPGLAMLRFPMNSSGPQSIQSQSLPYPSLVNGIQDLALEKTLVRMTDQSNVEIATLQREYAADLESLKQHLSDDIFRLNRERDTRIQALQDGVRLKGSSSTDTVDSIRKDTASKIETTQSTYDSNTKACEDQYLEQVAKLQSDLRASQVQVADARRVPGNHPNLQLAGTDLYTRNFIPSLNPPPPDELVATPERLIVDAHSRPGRTISRVVRDAAESPALPRGADLKVHGQLIKQLSH